MADKMTAVMRHAEEVSATFQDAQGFFATVTISREDLAKLVQRLGPDTRFGSGMEPDTDDVIRAGSYLLHHAGYQRQSIINMSAWARIWTAEAHGWTR